MKYHSLFLSKLGKMLQNLSSAAAVIGALRVKKVGMSAKFTSFWRRPFKITGKLSDILYKVNCGYNGNEQNIHCDRIRLFKQQILRGESEQVDEDVQSHAPENSDETMGTLHIEDLT